MSKEDAMVKHLANIDASLKELVRLSKPQSAEVTFGDGRPLVEDNPTLSMDQLLEQAVKNSKTLNNALSKVTPVRTVKRLTEPGEPITGGEGEYLLNPEADTSGN